MRIRPLRLHLDRHVGLFGSFISCIGNLGCLSYLSSIVLWFEFDLISQLILGFTADFVLQTSISIYSDFIWLCVKFELGWSQRKLWAPSGYCMASVHATLFQHLALSGNYTHFFSSSSSYFGPLYLPTLISIFHGVTSTVFVSLPALPPPWLLSSPLLIPTNRHPCSTAGVCRSCPFLPLALHPRDQFGSAIFC